jgi:hypothetical protein
MSPTEPTKVPPKAADPPAKKCIASCNTDKDCADSCPVAASGGAQCCDQKTKTCFATIGTCPAPVAESDGGAPTY